MTVSEFDPNVQSLVTASAAANAHLRAQLARSGHRCLRLGVKESGCNGYMYTLDYLDAPDPQDASQDLDDGVTVYVRRADVPMVRGTAIDYVVEGLNASLKFRNPNASTYCGCGESFAVAGG